jgi:hypothetical protein
MRGGGFRCPPGFQRGRRGTGELNRAMGTPAGDSRPLARSRRRYTCPACTCPRWRTGLGRREGGAGCGGWTDCDKIARWAQAFFFLRASPRQLQGKPDPLPWGHRGLPGGERRLTGPLLHKTPPSPPPLLQRGRIQIRQRKVKVPRQDGGQAGGHTDVMSQ